VTSKNAVWLLMNVRFEGTYPLHYHNEKNQQVRNNFNSNLLVGANVVPRLLLIVSTIMMEAISSSETRVLTRAPRHRIQDDKSPPSGFIVCRNNSRTASVV
jgi:hypothetical protein